MSLDDSNPIEVACPHCANSIRVPRSEAGQRISCSRCGRAVIVPAEAAPVSCVFDDLFEETPRATSPVKPVDLGPAALTASPREPRIEPNPPSVLPERFADNQDPFAEPGERGLERMGGEATAFDFGQEDLPAESPLIDPAMMEKSPDESGAAESHWIESGESQDAATPTKQSALTDAHKTNPQEIEEEFDPLLPSPQSQTDSTKAATLAAQNQGTEMTADDPFADDPNRPLRIEGLAPYMDPKNTAAVRCGICDTLIYVTRAQLGQKVKCPECYSEIVAQEAESRRSSSNPFNRMITDGVVMTLDEPAQSRESNSDNDEYRLSEPVARPKLEIPEAYGLGKDDRDLLAPLAPLAPNSTAGTQPVGTGPARTPESSVPGSAGKPHSPVEALPFDRPAVQRTGSDSPRMESPPAAQIPNAAADTSRAVPARNSPVAYWERQPERPPDPKAVEQERLASDPIGIRLTDLGSMTGKMTAWIRQMSTDLELWMRSGVAAVGLGFAYWMYDIIAGWLVAVQQETGVPPTGYQFWSLLLGLMGAVGLVVAVAALGITSGLMFQRGTEKQPRFEDWPGYGFGDWGPAVGFVLLSVWLASLPGLFLGLLVAIGTEFLGFIPLFGFGTVFAIAPPLLANAVYNESPWKIVAPPMIRNFQFDDTEWLRFIPGSGLAFGLFLAGLLILLIPNFVCCFLGAGFQVAAVILFASLTGLYCRLMADKVSEQEAH